MCMHLRNPALFASRQRTENIVYMCLYDLKEGDTSSWGNGKFIF